MLCGAGGSYRNVQKGRNAVGGDVVEEETIEDVETPAKPSGKQNKPLIPRHFPERAFLLQAVIPSTELKGLFALCPPMSCLLRKEASEIIDLLHKS